MTDIFALMWLADVSRTISHIATAALVAVNVAGLVMLLMAHADGVLLGLPTRLKHLCWLLIPVAVSLVIPSGDTIRLLAAAKAGGVLTAAKTGGKAPEAVDAMLDKVISCTKEK